jgi:putative Ca2+/H+ antiporter (TMEM165/GDT1 family)
MIEPISTGLTSFSLIALAELGDKSQLVCMTLAARYRALPVLLGACLAFALLNLLAVLFGALVASWIPPFWLGLTVAALFGLFGIQALLFDDEDDEAQQSFKTGHGIFISALLLIFVAEFGDKTQLAVAALGSNYPLLPVWLGATLALWLLTLLAVLIGQRLLTRLPLKRLHQLSGLLFIGLAALSLYQVL